MILDIVVVVVAQQSILLLSSFYVLLWDIRLGQMPAITFYYWGGSAEVAATPLYNRTYYILDSEHKK